MLKLEQVSKSFGEIAAVRQVSLTIPASQITIIAGADGAGKSTLFKMMVGLVKKDSGNLYLKGEPIHDKYDKITAITGYMPERFSLYPDLSVEENMNFFADIHCVPHHQREERKKALLETTGMSPFRKRRAGALSGGMKQKLALSTILLSAPELIILDEPTTGVDPLSRIEFFHIIEQLKNEGKTIVISTPYLDEAEQGDHLVFIKDGHVLREDSMNNLKRTFPARLFRLTPNGNIFQIMESLKKNPRIAHSVYIRGQYIKYLQVGTENWITQIPHTEAIEEAPRLEDIYLFYERLFTNDQGAS